MTAPNEDLIARLEDCAQNGFAHPVSDALMLNAATALRALQQEVERLRGELRRIAEGNLGPMSWQADYDKIRDTARSALTGSAQG